MISNQIIHKWTHNAGCPPTEFVTDDREMLTSSSADPFKAFYRVAVSMIAVATWSICLGTPEKPAPLSFPQLAKSEQIALRHSPSFKDKFVFKIVPFGDDPSSEKNNDHSLIEVSLRTQLKDTLATYSQYPENWDEDGANAPYRNAILDSMAFIDALPRELHMPEPMLEHDGSISFLWKSDRADAVARFRGDEKFAWFVDRFGHDLEFNDRDEIASINKVSQLILALKKAGFWDDLPTA